MPFTFYDSFVVQTQNTLHALAHIVDKGQKHANASTFPTSRLAPDMKSFSYQVFSATSQTLFVLARATDSSYPDVDVNSDITLTYKEMQDRITAALEALDKADKTYILEHCEDIKPTNLGSVTLPLSAVQFASVMQSNIFFHTVTAYNILRKDGVELGKADYILHFLPKQ